MRAFPIFSCCVISFQWLTLFVTRGGRNEKTNEEGIRGERLFMEWRDTQVIILAYLSACLSVHIMYNFSISDEKMWVINLNGVLPEIDDFPFHENSWCGSVYLHKLNNVNVMWMWKNWHWETAIGSLSDLNTSCSNTKIRNAQTSGRTWPKTEK